MRSIGLLFLILSLLIGQSATAQQGWNSVALSSWLTTLELSIRNEAECVGEDLEAHQVTVFVELNKRIAVLSTTLVAAGQSRLLPIYIAKQLDHDQASGLKVIVADNKAIFKPLTQQFGTSHPGDDVVDLHTPLILESNADESCFELKRVSLDQSLANQPTDLHPEKLIIAPRDVLQRVDEDNRMPILMGAVYKKTVPQEPKSGLLFVKSIVDIIPRSNKVSKRPAVKEPLKQPQPTQSSIQNVWLHGTCPGSDEVYREGPLDLFYRGPKHTFINDGGVPCIEPHNDLL